MTYTVHLDSLAAENGICSHLAKVRPSGEAFLSSIDCAQALLRRVGLFRSKQQLLSVLDNCSGVRETWDLAGSLRLTVMLSHTGVALTQSKWHVRVALLAAEWTPFQHKAESSAPRFVA